jgi:two-component system chemotaxis sensor kinase CheA
MVPDFKMSAHGNSFTQVLDEYFTECEEHLDSIHRHLIVMEGFVNRNLIDLNVVDELLRAFHSVKGLSAMASVHAAEQAAHTMEEVIRDLKQSGTGPTEIVMEMLVSGTGVIEEIIAARRNQRTFQEIGPPQPRIPSVAAPRSLWRFQFSPSAELSSRGINVARIRSRLQEIGEILNTTPHILDGGRIIFEFTVASDVEESRFSDWQSDGLTVAASPTTEISELRETAAATPVPSIVRVDMKRLDDLMTMLGDLIISRGHVEENLRQLEAILPASAWRNFQEANLLLQRQIRDLREGVMRIRMVPVGDIFERMRYVIRGLQRESQKDIRLELSGHDTEIDKLLVERMMDPLLHMVRNAVSHGLELPSERITAGKPPEGHLCLRASTEAETIVIELEDDGPGVDVKQVTERARAMGSIGPDEELDPSGLLRMICMPGFSTRQKADLGAGRGVGMAVVKATISGLGGTLAMDTKQGKGTRFTIRLPLTLAIIQALIVHINDQRFAVPRSVIHEVFRAETPTVTMENREVVPYRGGVLPIVHLRRLFRINGESKTALHVFVVGSDRGKLGIAVDRIAEQREIVVRALEDPLVRLPGIAGATELGDGRPVLILDVAALVDVARAHRTMAPESVIRS